MASILLILLVFVFVVIILLLSFGTYVLSLLFGGFMNLKNFVYNLLGWNNGTTRTNSANASSSKTSSHTSSAHSNTKGQSSSASQDKVFNKDEGTYIDFEEVK